MEEKEIRKREKEMGEVEGGIKWIDKKKVVNKGGMVKDYEDILRRRGGDIIRGDEERIEEKGEGWKVKEKEGNVKESEEVVEIGKK